MKYLRFLSILPVLLLVIAACRVNESPTNADGNTGGSMISTTIAGVVNDGAGQPLTGATVTVTANGVVKYSAITNKYGSFMIQNASVPESRCFILCKKNGYFTGSRAETPKAGGITEMRLTMQSNTTTYSVNSSSGGKITVGSASVSFPANAFVTSTGAAYTGTVNIAAKFLDPTKPAFYNSFSGDMAATRTDGSQTELLSYGVLRVQIKDGSGNELKLTAGKTASLSYPLAASMQKNAPASMPLWYFDETLGMWKEEGVVAKSGNTYTGEVTHFTDWNCDYPGKTGTIKGRVICNSGDGVEGVYVTIGQRKVITDSSGYFSRRVPMDIDFTVSINPAENNGMSASDVSVTALSSNEVRTLPDIKLSNCPALITGTIVDCEGESVPGTVVVTANGAYICHFTNTGAFKVRVPADAAMSIEATGYDGKLSLPVSVPMINSDDTYSVGTIAVCDNGSSAEFYDISYGTEYTGRVSLLSPDGSLVAINGHGKKATFFTEVYDVKTGIKLSSFVQDSSESIGNFSADGSKLLIHSGPSFMSVVNPRTGAIIQTISGNDGRILPDGSAVITMTGYTSPSIRMYSVADGSLIKVLSMNDFNSPKMVGLHGTNEILFFSMNPMKQEFHLIRWDFVADTKVGDVVVDPSSYYSSAFSPDCTIMGLTGVPGNEKMNFYSTITGEKLNSYPVIIPDSIGRGNIKYMGVANDNTFVTQGENDLGLGSLPPMIYNISNGNVQKVLAVPNPGVGYSSFNYTPDSRYLAGITNWSTKPSVRIWKLK